MHSTTLTVRPNNARGGTMAVPGDKSISHRSLMLAAMATGETRIHGLLESADCLATVDALRQLGVSIDKARIAGRNIYHVQGRGLGGLRQPDRAIDCGNSGTAMRLLAGVLAGQALECRLIGDSSLSRRPMRRIAEPLIRMGAVVEMSPEGSPPLHIAGRNPLSAIEYALPLPSAQVKSAILLAGLNADGVTRVIEPDVSRDHTERMLEAFGVAVKCAKSSVSLSPPECLASPGEIDIPGDLSSAAFFLVLGSIVSGCRIELTGVGINPTRDGILSLLRRMGARLDIRDRRYARGNEPVADIVVEPGALRGIELNSGDVALAIDEIPALLIAAACASGRTIVRGAADLRAKESDRLQAMAVGLRELGIETEEFEDGIMVEGGNLRGGTVDSRGDHRIAMAFAVAGAVAEEPVSILNTENIATSYPGFVQQAQAMGMEIREEPE